MKRNFILLEVIAGIAVPLTSRMLRVILRIESRTATDKLRYSGTSIGVSGS